METVDYYDVLQGCADLCGLDHDNISVREQAILRNLISKRLVLAWHYQLWPDLTRTEKRYYRPVYDATLSYAAGVELFYPATQQYYRSLAAIAPLGYPADPVTGITDVAFWQVCALSYTLPTYDAKNNFVAGDQVYNPPTDKNYQAIAANFHHDPTEPTYWAQIVEFIRNVARDQTGKSVIGTVLGAFRSDPRAGYDARGVAFQLRDTGVQIMEDVPLVWLWFRLRCPVLVGAKWSSTATYAANKQVYYRSAALPGNFYTANASTAAGESPESTPAKWDIVQLPAAFKGYLEHGAAADYLMPEGEDGAGPHRGVAQGMLEDLAAVLLGQEDQFQRVTVQTR